MAIQKLYKSRMPSCQYFFKDGSRADFVNGRFSTDEEDKIEQLDKELKANHPHIYVDDNEVEVDTEKQDPLEHLRAKFIAEYLKEQKDKVGTDFGKTSGDAKAGMLTTAKLDPEAAKESLSASIKVGAVGK